MLSERDRLASGAEELGVALQPAQVERLVEYLDVLYLWNRRAGLTTIDRADAVRLHLLDSLSAVPMLDAGTVADLGTGAGLPGIPVSIVRDDLEISLIESNRRRCSFLFEAVRTLGLRVEVLETDVESLGKSGRRFDTVISRAFRAPVEFVGIAARFVARQGSIVVMTTPAHVDQLRDRAGEAVGMMHEHRFRLPGGAEERALVKLSEAVAQRFT